MAYETFGKVTISYVPSWGTDILYKSEIPHIGGFLYRDYPASCIEGTRDGVVLKLDVTGWGGVDWSDYNYAKIVDKSYDVISGHSQYSGHYFISNYRVVGRWVYLTLTKNLLQSYREFINECEEVIVATSDEELINRSLPNGNYIVKPEKEYKYVEIPTPFGIAGVDTEHNSNMVIEVVGV